MNQLRHDARWDEFRAEMPVAQKWAYFDHAAVAPLSGPAQRALLAWSDDATLNGEANWSNWRQTIERTRRLAATLLGAELDEVALIRNTTEGVNLVAAGFPWQAGDNVVVPDGEFPTNLYPWLHLESLGVQVRRVPLADGRLDLQKLDDACDGRTRIVAASWVGYASGWRTDVDALCEIAHRNQARLFLDAIQALGVFPLDVKQTPVDFLAADGHKWLLGPEGAGIFYIRSDRLDELRPTGVGWNSVRHAGDFANLNFDLKSSAGRYEGGSYNMAGFHALAASLDLLLSFGVPAISQRLLEVTDDLCQRLGELGAEIASGRDAEHRSGIVSFNLPDVNPQPARVECLKQGVVLNCRAGRLRVSPHAYTSDDDVDRLIHTLAAQR